MVQRRHQPSLIILRSFESAARHQSFTAAATELNLTQSAISRHIRDLEETLGLSLFQRVGRRVVLTPPGAGFAQRLARDLDRIEQTVLQTIAAGSDKACLRIATLPTFAARWLIPRLADFEARNPTTEIMLATRLQPFDMIGEQFDLAIHYGEDTWPDAELTWLCGEEMVAVASPAFIDAHNVKAPADLANVPLLHLETRPDAWPDWLEGAANAQIKGLSGKRFDQFSMIISAALASLGAALLPRFLIRRELLSNALIQIGDYYLKTQNSYFIARPTDAVNDHADRFIEWISQQAEQDS